MSIAKKIPEFQKKLEPAKLVVVTKKRSRDEVEEVVGAGVKDIAENQIQEIQKKYDQSFLQQLKEKGVKLHFIGQIQSNKIRKIVQSCDVIQSLSSWSHAQKIQTAAEEFNKNIDVFIQLNLTEEKQKQGLFIEEDHQELYDLFTKIQELSLLNMKGFMCMGKFGDEEKTRKAFRTCKALADAFNLSEVSMGMSGDYEIAVEEGSTMLRVGSTIFE
jgi:pyridoxal phosphate enzyme (YggS family)